MRDANVDPRPAQERKHNAAGRATAAVNSGARGHYGSERVGIASSLRLTLEFILLRLTAFSLCDASILTMPVMTRHLG